VEIVIANASIANVSADLIALKYANDWHGADKLVSQLIGFNDHLADGKVRFCRGRDIAASEALFIGVGPLRDFRFERIQAFGARAVQLSQQHFKRVRHLAMTIHGPGYGLDPEQSFLSLIAGIITRWKDLGGPLEKVTIAELSSKRCEQFSKILIEKPAILGYSQDANPQPSVASLATTKFGTLVDSKPRLFVAMPFDDDFIDVYTLAFCEAAAKTNYVCERLDLVAFTGDIVSEIKNRIVGSQAVVALLNDHNPNVFLEVGFAWAHSKPTILVAHEGVKLPFDVGSHRCIRYRNLTQLRDLLTEELASLKSQGILAG
jgi:hypothetical protein